MDPRDEPPVYCYANWDEATRNLVGAESFPPADYCNVSCAYHMGDPVATYRRVRTAVQEGKAVCAHPGLDIAVNGRPVSTEDVYTWTICQLGALKGLVEAEGGKVASVKPHGMLYILLRDQPDLMRAFLKAQIALFGRDIPFHGLSQTNHEFVAVQMNVPFVGEILKDKVDLRRRATSMSSPDTPRRPLLGIRQSVRSVRSGPSRSTTSPPSTATSLPPSPPPSIPAALLPSRSPSSGASSPASSAPSSSPSSCRTSTSDDNAPRTIANTLTLHDIHTPLDVLNNPRSSSASSTPGPISPTPSSAKNENSAVRLLRQFHYWTMTPIPTMIEEHRSTPAAAGAAPGSGAGTPSRSAPQAPAQARGYAAPRPTHVVRQDGCETQ